MNLKASFFRDGSNAGQKAVLLFFFFFFVADDVTDTPSYF